MPRIYIEWLEGRSREKRDLLAKKITENFMEILDLKANQITIVFKENRPEMLYKASISYDKLTIKVKQ